MWPGYINTRDKWAHSYECFILFITWCKTIQFLSFLWRRKVKVKVTQLCPTLCDPTDSTVHGILQARILEWVAFPFSRGSSELRDQTEVSQIAGGFFTSWATRGNPRRLEWIKIFSGHGIPGGHALSFNPVPPFYHLLYCLWFPSGLTGLISLLSTGLSRVPLQYHNLKASILWRSAFLMVQLLSVRD